MNTSLSADHSARMQRVRLALEGIALGDAFGSQFFVPKNHPLLERRQAPPPPWHYTDDAEMALGIAEVLDRCGFVEQDELAQVFVRRWDRDMYRGYGSGAHLILNQVRSGIPWAEAARSVFDGQGSMGNGGAMRVAPVGAYFAEDDWPVLVEQARRSAEVTHAHHEGQAGAIAAAVASACAWRTRGIPLAQRRLFLWQKVLELTPRGMTLDLLESAHALPLDADLELVVYELGNGSRVLAWDTVPFTLWVASKHLEDLVGALWTTVQAGGDIDTTGAIVGGIVVLSTGVAAIPPEWFAARESLDLEGTHPPRAPDSYF